MSASYVSEELLFMWLLLIAAVVASFFILQYNLTLITPSAAALCLGIVAGTGASIAGMTSTLRFSPTAFFYGLLPPIVFAAGFTLKKKDFFKNAPAIAVFAVGGTLVSTLVFGLLTYLLVVIHVVQHSALGPAPLTECMLYGALISATDPVATLSIFSTADVPPLLYNLVFGESVLNDAVAIVLFQTLQKSAGAPLRWAALPLLGANFAFIGIGSMLVGVLVALPCAFVLRRFQVAADGARRGSVELSGSVYEIALVILSAYMAYLVAEVCGLSGIVALFFTGICHAHYSYYNVTPDAQVTLRRFFEFAAFLSETFVFAYLGLQVPLLSRTAIDWGLMLTGIPLCLLARAANIFPLSAALNARRRIPLPRNLQLMLWSAGLRGAVAFGLVLQLRPTPGPDQPPQEGLPAIEAATLVIVVISTLVFGTATGPLLRHLSLEGIDDDGVAAMGYVQLHGGGVSPAAALQAVREMREGQEGGPTDTWAPSYLCSADSDSALTARAAAPSYHPPTLQPSDSPATLP
ncbi:hypothetical protein WJX81_005547 [Elliptochloris bilobata]|uniref:Sodium/hydrogen exchanger n=1 Tax=Elliptochloris bilobata TaxID=381761 RepID=A0AAW1SCD4_9CHLO